MEKEITWEMTKQSILDQVNSCETEQQLYSFITKLSIANLQATIEVAAKHGVSASTLHSVVTDETIQ